MLTLIKQPVSNLVKPVVLLNIWVWLGLLLAGWPVEPVEVIAAPVDHHQSGPASRLQTIGTGPDWNGPPPGQIEPTGVLSDSLVITPPPEPTEDAHRPEPVCPPLEDVELTRGQNLLINGLFNTAAGVAGTFSPRSALTERVNILLLGSDSRSDEKNGRTDTLILATIDPAAKTAGMLSIPRDLWVSIPGYGEDRINAAYRLGQIQEHPGGGIALVKETIEANLGVPIHHYVLVDFEGFQQIIETLGGLDICIPETIDAATYYGYPAQAISKEGYYSFVPASLVETAENNPTANLETTEQEKGYQFLYIEAGQHSLDGYTTLRYARSRASATADFARVKRQQAVLLAIRDKALRLGIIPKLPQLWQTMNQTVETDLQLADLLQLSRLAYKIPLVDIQTEAIGIAQTTGHRTSSGAQVLLPRWPEIQGLIAKIFGDSRPATPLAETEPGSPPPVEPSQPEPLPGEVTLIEHFRATVRP